MNKHDMTAKDRDKFSSTELDRLLAALPPAADTPAGKKVVVGVDGDPEGQTLYAGFKLQPVGEGLAWELQAYRRHDRTTGNSYGLKTILDWP